MNTEEANSNKTCGNCKWWERPIVSTKPGYGQCNHPNDKLIADCSSSYDVAWVLVKRDFGCNRFEQK